MAATSETEQMKALLRYANYRKVGDALGVTKEAVRQWASGNDVSPGRITEIKRLVIQQLAEAGTYEEAPPPQWATGLQRGVSALLEHAGISPADERDKALARAVAEDVLEQQSRSRVAARNAKAQ